MGGAFKLEVELKGTRYVLNRTAAEMLLERIDAFGDNCGETCKRMRGDLRKALAETDDAARGAEEAEVSEEVTFRMSVLPGDPGAAGTPCFLCEEPGERIPGNPGDTEDLWVCRTEGCPREGKPAAREFFTTGHR